MQAYPGVAPQEAALQVSAPLQGPAQMPQAAAPAEAAPAAGGGTPYPEKIFVGGLPPQLRTDELRAHFET